MAKILSEKLMLGKEQMEVLSSEFSVPKGTVYHALAYRINSKKAKAMRERALELGAATCRVFK